MANYDVTNYKIGNDTYYYRDNQSVIALDNKVNKEEGKGLSSNDYTTEEKTKLSSITAGAQPNPPIDDYLNSSSTNAVENATLYNKFEEIRTEFEVAADASTLGRVKIGNNIFVTGDGTISVAAPYELPSAEANVLGGIKVGTGLSVAADGTLSTDPPLATTSSLGVVQVGSNLSIDANGVLSAPSLTPYVLPIATNLTLGGIQVGDGLSIDAQYGLLSVNPIVLSGTATPSDVDDGVNGNIYLKYDSNTNKIIAIYGKINNTWMLYDPV